MQNILNFKLETTNEFAGKQISDNMLSGYTLLNDEIGNTINAINLITSTSKDQMNQISLINDTNG